MYQVERQDKSNNVLAALALIAAALAYLGIAALLLGDVKLPGGSWTSAFLAFPLWVAASFQVLLVQSGLIISKSVEIIERRLVISLGFGSDIRPKGGVRASAQGFTVYERPTVLKIQSFICYGGIWAVIVFFSTVCLAVAARSASWTSAPVIIASMTYMVFFVGDIAAWLQISKTVKNISMK